MVELKEDRYGEYGVPDVKRKGCKLCPVKFKLELLIDIHMFLMFEKSIQVFKQNYMVDVDGITPEEID